MIKQYLPEHFRIYEQEGEKKVLPTFFRAIDSQFEYVEDLIEFYSKQFDFTTASGRYLIRLASSRGLVLPRFSGIGQESLRKLAGSATVAPKQNLAIASEMLEIFYGSRSVKPSFVAQNPAPYYIQTGDTLSISVSSGTVDISFDASVLTNPFSVSAEELASYCNSQQSTIFFDVLLNRENGKRFLRATAPGLGTSEFIQASKGSVQNMLKFPKTQEVQGTPGNYYTFSKIQPWSDEIIMTFVTGVTPEFFNCVTGDLITFKNMLNLPGSGPHSVESLDAYGRPTGNYIISGLNGDYSVLNSNTYKILDVGVDYLKIRIPNFDAGFSGGFTQRSVSDFVVTNQNPSKLYDQTEYSLVSESLPGVLSILLPAVPPIIKKTLRGSAHLRNRNAPVLSFTRTTMIIDTFLIPETIPNESAFVLSSSRLESDHANGYYRSVSVTGNTIVVDDSLINAPVLPFTVPTLVNIQNPITFANNRQTFSLQTSFNHGLRRGMKVSLSGASAPYTAINSDWTVQKVDSFFKVTFEAPLSLITAVTQSIAGVTILRDAQINPDGSDLFFVSATPAFWTEYVGKTIFLKEIFAPTPGFTVILNPAVANSVLGKWLVVINVDINTGKISIRSGAGPGVDGVIASNVTINYIPVSIGATAIQYSVNPVLNSELFNSLTMSIVSDLPALTADYKGAYLFDPTGSSQNFAVSSVKGLLSEIILKGSNDNSVSITSSEQIPEQGHVIFAFDTNIKEGPVRYNSRTQISANQYLLNLDPTFTFQNTHLQNENINVVRKLTPFIPKSDGSSLQAYVTGIKTTRDFAIDLIKKNVAAGVFVEVDLKVPDLVYADPSIKIYE